ncbi:MAG: hypothetical protein HQM02_06395 [Magnetococcales bacterium]|nr:hypothetical protein [Magnetococcales bacterium]
MDHSQHQQSAAAEASHADKMEGKMAKMSVRMEKMQQELALARERMNASHELLERIQQTPPGVGRNEMLAEHGAGLRAILTTLRNQMETMMTMMEQHHDKNQKGMDHGGGAGGKMDHEMMGDMARHHEAMRLRLELLTHLTGQAESHLQAVSQGK